MESNCAGGACREVENPFPLLEEAGGNGCAVYLLLDPLCHPRAIAELHAGTESEISLVFLGTELEPLHELSPRFAQIQPDSRVFKWLMQSDPGWGMLLVSPAPVEEVLAHVRSLLLAKSDGGEVIFRCWDGRILARLCQAVPEEIPLLLGPIRRVIARTEENAWACIDRGSEHDFLSRPHESGLPLPCPWYRFTRRHDEVFRDKRLRVASRNIAHALCSSDPERQLPPFQDESLHHFVSRHVKRADSYGLVGREALELFVRCSLHLGESFPDVRKMPVLKPFAGQTIDENAAMAAMRTVLHQGGLHA
jgi:hypothetical protein